MRKKMEIDEQLIKWRKERGLPIIKPENCPSTHGAAGYAPGSYVREDGKVVCGLCGAVLEPRKEAIGDWMPRMPKKSRKK